MVAPTLNGLTLGKVQSIDVDKTGNLLALPLPTGDSDETEVFDMLGVTKNLTVSGTITGASIADVKSDLDALEGLIDGDQASSVTFSSDQTGSITVKVNRITISWAVPAFSANYTIQLIQGV